MIIENLRFVDSPYRALISVEGISSSVVWTPDDCVLECPTGSGYRALFLIRSVMHPPSHLFGTHRIVCLSKPLPLEKALKLDASYLTHSEILSLLKQSTSLRIAAFTARKRTMSTHDD